MWICIGHNADGEPFEIDGVNVWDHQWLSLHDMEGCFDPSCGTRFVPVYRINTPEKTVRFAAQEDSNCVWGFYK